MKNFIQTVTDKLMPTAFAAIQDDGSRNGRIEGWILHNHSEGTKGKHHFEKKKL